MRAGGVGLIAISVALLQPALADPTPLSGPIYLEDVLLVGEGETLRVGPDTSITGPGRIEVWGALLVEGNRSARAEIAVPITLEGNASSRIVDARLWGVRTAALTVRAGSLSLDRVAFEGNAVGLAVAGNATVAIQARDVLFRAHASEGARILAPATATFEGATFQDNARGLVVDASLATGDVLIASSKFERNGQHLLVALGSGHEPMRLVLEGSDVGPVSPIAGARQPSIVVHSDLLFGEDPDRIVTLRANHLHDGDVALRVEGRGYHVVSENDNYTGNRIGISLAGSSVTLRGATLDSTERDIDGAATSTLALQDVVFASAATTVPASGVALSPWLAPALAASAVIAGGGAWLALRRRARSANEPPPAPPPPPADLAAPLKTMELRVMQDVAANPATAQAAIAARLGLSRQALHYHVKKLEARGLIVKRAQGRETRCFVPDTVKDALGERLSPPQVTDPDAVEKA